MGQYCTWQLRILVEAGQNPLTTQPTSVGIAVHIGARVAALASAGEILVSGAVPPLVVGSGLDFADGSKHELKGIPGSWCRFAVKD